MVSHCKLTRYGQVNDVMSLFSLQRGECPLVFVLCLGEKARRSTALPDVSLSGEDGREMCWRLKDNETSRHIPVILISADDGMGKRVDGFGANDFLAKPFHISDLSLCLIYHLFDRYPSVCHIIYTYIANDAS
jgi:CheY-like chemotaxis protein